MNNGIKGKDSENKFFTIEFFGVTLIISSFLFLVCLLFGENVFFELGEEIKYFLLGLFGYFAYPLLFSLIMGGFMMLLGKKPQNTAILKAVSLFWLIFLILTLFTLITNLKKPVNMSSYLKNAYQSGRYGVNGVVAGGVLFSLLSFVLVKYLTYVGGVLTVSAVLLLDIVLRFRKAKLKLEKGGNKSNKGSNKQGDIQGAFSSSAKDNNSSEPQINPNPTTQPNGYQNQQPIYPNGYQPQPNFNQNGYQNPTPNNNLKQNGYYNGQNNAPNSSNSGYYYGGFSVPNNNQSQPPVDRDLAREEAMRILYGGQPNTYSYEYSRDYMDDKVRFSGQENSPKPNFTDNNMVSNPIPKQEPAPKFEFEDKSSEVSANTFVDDFSYEDVSDVDESKYSPKQDTNVSTDFFRSIIAKKDNVDKNENLSIVEDDNSELVEEINNEPIIEPTFDDVSTSTMPYSENSVIEEENENIIENMPINGKYNPPPISLLKTVDKSGDDYKFELFKNNVKTKILETLSNFGVETRIARVFRGPAVTRFDIEIPSHIPMSRVTKLQSDINLRVAATSPIRMIAPVPGTSYVGIEVPNDTRDTVTIKDIVTSDTFLNSEDFSLVFALGKDVIGTPVSLDLAKMPHLLVTGTTGSGKSVCLNTLIISLILKYSPEELRFIIVDPKAVEFEIYDKIPHLYFGEIIKDDIPTTNAMLNWVVEEMGRRYETFSKCKLRDIKSYNKKARLDGNKIMPRLVLIIDEFADIMLKDKAGANTKICLLVQKARAAGIHLVLAAQRPSVDIIEGPIKANLPSRIVFRATSPQDSMTSLGEIGAEKLLGRGDCLYKTEGMFAVERVMGAYVSDEEMYDIVDYLNANNEAYFDRNAWTKISACVNSNDDEYTPNNVTQDSFVSGEIKDGNFIDPLNVKAMRIGYDYGGLSTSFLQRKLGVGYPRAAKIIDWLTDNGYLSANSVQGKKQMLLDKQEFEEKFGTDEYGQ